MLRSTLIFALAAMFSALPAQADSGHGREAVSATVSYRGLNLAEPAGQIALDQRIARAARRLCRVSRSRGTYHMAAESRCRREAVASASSQRDLAIATATRRQRLAGALLAMQASR